MLIILSLQTPITQIGKNNIFFIKANNPVTREGWYGIIRF